MHVVSYLADVTGNGAINASDASRLARFAAQLVSEFSAAPLADPRILAEISGNGAVNAFDASLVAQFAALFDVPRIPPVPAGVVVAGGGTVAAGPGHPLPTVLLPSQRQVAPPVEMLDAQPSPSPFANQGTNRQPTVDQVMSIWSREPAGMLRKHQDAQPLEEAIASLLLDEHLNE